VHTVGSGLPSPRWSSTGPPATLDRMDEDEHPELAGYEPHRPRSLRSKRTLLILRVVVVIGIASLLLPGIVTMVRVGANTADMACADFVAFERPDSPSYEVRFQLFGPGVAGYECYTKDAFGGDEHIASLGVIPSGRVASEVVERGSRI
jgi:hypothetical protein